MIRTAWVLLALALSAGESWAQGAAISTIIDTGIRASGMGRAGTALWWGDNPDTWANPSLLGYQQGIRYVHGKTQLVPDIATDVFLRSDGVAVGAYGLGFFLSGKPIDGFGRVRLDYGTSDIRDPSGQDLGTFSSYEESDSWSIGANILELTDNVAQLASKKSPGLSRWGDVSLGLAKKHVALVLSPDFPFLAPGAGQSEFDAQDKGYLVRLTPYNGMDRAGYLPGVDEKVRARFDLAYGQSEINENNPTVTFVGTEPDPVAKDSRKGLALRLAVHPTAKAEAKVQQGGWRWLTHLWNPALSLAYVWDQSDYGSEAIIDTSGQIGSTEDKAYRHGFEAVFLNMIGLRFGHVHEPSGSIDGTTWGFDVGFNYEHCGGARYEWASVPQAKDENLGIQLADVHRAGFVAFIEPIHLWKVIH
jgi:hypothetical protein